MPRHQCSYTTAPHNPSAHSLLTARRESSQSFGISSLSMIDHPTKIALTDAIPRMIQKEIDRDNLPSTLTRRQPCEHHCGRLSLIRQNLPAVDAARVQLTQVQMLAKDLTGSQRFQAAPPNQHQNAPNTFGPFSYYRGHTLEEIRTKSSGSVSSQSPIPAKRPRLVHHVHRHGDGRPVQVRRTRLGSATCSQSSCDVGLLFAFGTRPLR